MIDLRENASTVSPPDAIFVTAAQIASPTAAMLASTGSTFALNVAPYTRYYSNGSALVALYPVNPILSRMRQAGATHYGSHTTTVVPEIGATPTHTRATAYATVKDHLGIVQYCKSGETRFSGARRVCNLAGSADTFAAPWSLGVNTTVTLNAGIGGPTSRHNVYAVARTSGNSNMLTLGSTTYRPDQHTFSIFLATSNGTTPLTIRIERSSDSALVAQAVVTPPAISAGGLVRYFVSGDILDSTNHRCYVTDPVNEAFTFYAACGQMERTYGQSGVPNEPIVTGISGAAAPYQGANVDGVQYFDTYNPWIDAGGNVATDSGLSSQRIATLAGVLLEPAVSNHVYSSGDLSDAVRWTLNRGSASTVSNSIYGKNRAVKFIEDTATGAHGWKQNWQGTAAANDAIVTLSVTAAASERNWLYLDWTSKADGLTVIASACFDLTNGVVGTVTGADTATQMVQEADGKWRCSLSGRIGSGASTPCCRFGPAQSNGTYSYAGTSGSGVVCSCPQWEALSVGTSYADHTGTAAVYTRNGDVFTIPTTGILPTNDFSMGETWTPYYRTSIDNKHNYFYLMYGYFDATNRWGLSIRPGTVQGLPASMADDIDVDIYPNSASYDGQEITTFEKLYGQAARCGFVVTRIADAQGSGMRLVVDGATSVQSANATTDSVAALANVPTTINVGAELASATFHPSAYRDLWIIPKALSAAEITALTA